VTDRAILDLLLMNADDIDYDSLPTATLRALAVEVEPYIATYALAELSSRDQRAAGQAAREILAGQTADAYLRSSALRALYRANADEAVAWIADNVAESEDVLVKAIVELLDDEDDWCGAPSSGRALEALARRLAHPSGEPDLIDREAAARVVTACDD
jgi:hypothetical protein